MFEDDPDGRDAHGRWKKGHCPNPRGRPRNKAEISDADVNHFMNTAIKATINGEERYLTRQELLLHKMFEGALKGSVLIQRKLFDRFEKSEETYAEARMHHKEVSKKILAGYDKTGKIDEILLEDYRELAILLGKDPDRPVRARRKPRITKKAAAAPSWRKGPKPQSLLDLERREAEEEAAEQARWAARRKPPEEPQEPDDD